MERYRYNVSTSGSVLGGESLISPSIFSASVNHPKNGQHRVDNSVASSRPVARKEFLNGRPLPFWPVLCWSLSP